MRGKKGFWPRVPVSPEFRETVKTVLQDSNFPHATSILVKPGGLGDFVQMTAVAKALKQKEPEKPIVAVMRPPFGSLLDDHPYIDAWVECKDLRLHQMVKSLIDLTDNVFDLRYVSCGYGTWENSQYFFDNVWYYDKFPQSGRSLENLDKHICDIMLFSLGIEEYADCNDVYIKPDEVPQEITGDYVVVCGSPGFPSEGLKKWSVQEWDGLINWLRQNGIKPVQLGLSSNRLLHPDVIDLRGKTTPRQAAGYLRHSKGYVGIEGGLFHLAKATKTPAVVVFTSTSERCYAYPDTLPVSKRLCRPCMWEKSWSQARCLYRSRVCLNIPDWQDVSLEVSAMLERASSNH